MSDCDSTAPVSEDVLPVEVPDTSQAIAIIPLPEDLRFDTVTEEHENDDLADIWQERKSYTVEYKLNVLDWYHANGENKKQTALHFGVDRKRIRDWVKVEQELRAEPPSNMQRRKKNTGCTPHYRALDQAMLEWCKKQKMEGRTITNQVLRTKALELAPQLGYGDTFKASSNWACAWRRRNKAVFSHGNTPLVDVAALINKEDSQQEVADEENSEQEVAALIDEEDSQQFNTNPEIIHEVRLILVWSTTIFLPNYICT